MVTMSTFWAPPYPKILFDDSLHVCQIYSFYQKVHNFFVSRYTISDCYTITDYSIRVSRIDFYNLQLLKLNYFFKCSIILVSYNTQYAQNYADKITPSLARWVSTMRNYTRVILLKTWSANILYNKYYHLVHMIFVLLRVWHNVSE